MVENNPVLNKKQFVEFSFFPCSSEYEQLIGSGIDCNSTAETLKHIQQSNSVIGKWWIEQLLIPNPKAEGANPINPLDDQKAYVLYPHRE